MVHENPSPLNRCAALYGWASSGRLRKCASASGFASASMFFTGCPCTTLRTASSTILFDLVRGISGTCTIFAGTCRGVVWVRIWFLIFATSPSSRASPSRSFTNSTTHVADLTWRPGLADHERLDHLLHLLDLAVDLGRSDAHAARVEHRIRSAVDDHAIVPGDLAPVAVGPDPRKSLEVGGLVFLSVGVVPESNRQRWKWPRADKLAFLLFHRAGVFVEHLHPEAQGAALDFAAPYGQDRVSEHEASADVGAPRD